MLTTPFCSVKFNAANKSKIPIPPLNSRDPFLSKLASVAATSPETLLNRPVNSDTPPFLDFFYSPKLMATPAQIHTVAVGAAIGQACLLLSAGTPGKRFMMPHAKAMIQQLRVPSSGLMPASDVLIRAKEVIINRDTLIKLLAKHKGNVSITHMYRMSYLFREDEANDSIIASFLYYWSEETVTNVMKRPFYMDSTTAKEFGVIDKILWRGQEGYG